MVIFPFLGCVEPNLAGRMASSPGRPLRMKEAVFGLDFHPSASALAVGLVTGAIHLFDLAQDQGSRRLWRTKAHRSACRDVRFSPDGAHLVSVGSDGRVCRLHAGDGQKADVLGAHDCAVNVVRTFRETEVVTGDDDGGVRVWDVRQQMPAASFAEQGDLITDLRFCDHASPSLLATSADGTFACYDLRKGRLGALSDNLEDELLSVALVKAGRKVVCGSQGGVLNTFSYGDFGDISDRYPGHPGSVDALEVLDEHTLLSACSDGYVRAVSVQPWGLVGVVADHGGQPLECIRLNADRTKLATCAHDNVVRLWDVDVAFPRVAKAARARVEDNDSDPDSGADDEEEEDGRRRRRKRTKARNELRVPGQKTGAAVHLDSNFAAGLAS